MILSDFDKNFAHTATYSAGKRSESMKAFTEPPESVGESYFEHMVTSFSFGGRMLLAGIGCILHGIFPFLCTKTGSATICALHRRMVTHRDKRTPCPDAEKTAA